MEKVDCSHISSTRMYTSYSTTIVRREDVHMTHMEKRLAEARRIKKNSTNSSKTMWNVKFSKISQRKK
jgi:hypothetical protein